MKVVTFLIALIFCFSGQAKIVQKTFTFRDYEHAKSSNQFIKFYMESTKAGLVTTSFEGLVKKFTLRYDKQETELNSGLISFDVLQIDTDSDGRNEKMHNKCFSKDQYPQIKVQLGERIEIGKEKKIPATIQIRGKQKAIWVTIKAAREGDKIRVSGTSTLGLKNLEIPDPSIWIAKVRDQIDLSFNVLI
jgi:hypothetical protein